MHKNITIVILFPRSLSAGWIGIILYVLLMLVFFKPNDATTLATLSTEMYDNEHNSGFMPSLTLEAGGRQVHNRQIQGYSLSCFANTSSWLDSHNKTVYHVLNWCYPCTMSLKFHAINLVHRCYSLELSSTSR